MGTVQSPSGSSIRWKRKIKLIDEPLEKILSLRGVKFYWDEDHGGHQDIGFIAEEVGKVLPEIVNYEDDGIYAIGLDYSKTTPLIVEGIKFMRNEYQKQLEKQEILIIQLSKKVSELEKLVDQIYMKN